MKQENSKRSRHRPAVVAVLILAAVVVAGFAGVQGGVLKRARGAYDRWSLRSRVDALWESRLQGDIAKSERFVVNDGKPRAPLGGAVRYLAYEVQEMKIEGEKADVKLSIQYRVDLPGFSRETDPPETGVISQSWVRTGEGWYWDPGPIPGSTQPVRVDPEVPAPPSPPGDAPKR